MSITHLRKNHKSGITSERFYLKKQFWKKNYLEIDQITVHKTKKLTWEKVKLLICFKFRKSSVYYFNYCLDDAKNTKMDLIAICIQTRTISKEVSMVILPSCVWIILILAHGWTMTLSIVITLIWNRLTIEGSCNRIQFVLLDSNKVPAHGYSKRFHGCNSKIAQYLCQLCLMKQKMAIAWKPTFPDIHIFFQFLINRCCWPDKVSSGSQDSV